MKSIVFRYVFMSKFSRSFLENITSSRGKTNAYEIAILTESTFKLSADCLCLAIFVAHLKWSSLNDLFRPQNQAWRVCSPKDLR